MAASEVFTKMLTSDMKEAQSGRILLKDKTKDQLTEVLNHLDLRNGAEPPPVTEKNVELLVQFADEYEVTGLRHRCIAFLKKQTETKRCAYLELACKYNLPEIIEPCVHTLLKMENIKRSAAKPEPRNILLGLENDKTVRRIIYSDLLQMFGKLSDQKLGEAPQGQCSEHWKVLVDLLLEMKRAQQHDEKFKLAASTEWMAAFKALVVTVMTEFEKPKNPEYSQLMKDLVNPKKDEVVKQATRSIDWRPFARSARPIII